MEAARTGDFILLKLLYSKRAHINAKNTKGNNALWYSLSDHISVQTLQCLIDMGININNQKKLVKRLYLH